MGANTSLYPHLPSHAPPTLSCFPSSLPACRPSRNRTKMERRSTTAVEQKKVAVGDIAGIEPSGHVVAPTMIAPSSPIAGPCGWQRSAIGSPEATGARFVTPDNDPGSSGSSVSGVLSPQLRTSAAKKGLVFEGKPSNRLRVQQYISCWWVGCRWCSSAGGTLIRRLLGRVCSLFLSRPNAMLFLCVCCRRVWCLIAFVVVMSKELPTHSQANDHERGKSLFVARSRQNYRRKDDLLALASVEPSFSRWTICFRLGLNHSTGFPICLRG